MSLPAPYDPVPVDKVRIAFPAGVVADLMPAEDEIPPEFWNRNAWTGEPATAWVSIADSWFHSGLPATVEFHMKDGIDGQTAFDHLRCVMGSFEPKHQHKIAAAAFLLSTWCHKVENWEQP